MKRYKRPRVIKPKLVTTWLRLKRDPENPDKITIDSDKPETPTNPFENVGGDSRVVYRQFLVPEGYKPDKHPWTGAPGDIVAERERRKFFAYHYRIAQTEQTEWWAQLLQTHPQIPFYREDLEKYRCNYRNCNVTTKRVTGMAKHYGEKHPHAMCVVRGLWKLMSNLKCRKRTKMTPWLYKWPQCICHETAEDKNRAIYQAEEPYELTERILNYDNAENGTPIDVEN